MVPRGNECNLSLPGDEDKELWRVLCEGSNNVWLTNAFSSYLDTIKSKFFTSHGAIFIFDIKFNKHSEDKALSSL